jgi:hypothetical protein
MRLLLYAIAAASFSVAFMGHPIALAPAVLCSFIALDIIVNE